MDSLSAKMTLQWAQDKDNGSTTPVTDENRGAYKVDPDSDRVLLCDLRAYFDWGMVNLELGRKKLDNGKILPTTRWSLDKQQVEVLRDMCNEFLASEYGKFDKSKRK